jgi:prepilin-type N-terminal cleavage/methylation domain-containing protein
MIRTRFRTHTAARSRTMEKRMTYKTPEVIRARHPRYARGFTLIEIMVVVIIIGLLAAVIVPTVIGKVDEARVVKAKQDIQSLETALTMYRLDNSKYPTTEQGLTALVTQPPIRRSSTGSPVATCSASARTPGATTTST